jgi:hypothetical protein
MKSAAAALMVCDHVNDILLGDQHPELWAIGRLAFPLFCLIMAVNCSPFPPAPKEQVRCVPGSQRAAPRDGEKSGCRICAVAFNNDSDQLLGDLHELEFRFVRLASRASEDRQHPPAASRSCKPRLTAIRSPSTIFRQASRSSTRRSG